MSTEAIQRVMNELRGLPEADQQLILRFLTALRVHRSATDASAASNEINSALQVKNGLLVFTGQVDAPDTDWLQIVRDERDDELMRLAVGNNTPR
jgi:hypothetical protein